VTKSEERQAEAITEIYGAFSHLIKICEKSPAATILELGGVMDARSIRYGLLQVGQTLADRTKELERLMDVVETLNISSREQIRGLDARIKVASKASVKRADDWKGKAEAAREQVCEIKKKFCQLVDSDEAREIEAERADGLESDIKKLTKKVKKWKRIAKGLASLAGDNIR